MRPRRVFWDYGELFSVTLLLIFWSVLYRALFTFHVIVFQDDLDEGWLYGTGVPALWALLFVLSGALAMTAGCLVEPRNRTPLGFSIAFMNLAFALLLGAGIANHTAFALAQGEARFERRRTPANLEREVLGRWEVVARHEAPGAPHLPGDVALFEREHSVRFDKNVDPMHVESWWSVGATDSVGADLPFEWICFTCGLGETNIFETQESPYYAEPPALLLEVFSRNGSNLGDYWVVQRWAAAMDRADPVELVLVSFSDDIQDRPASEIRLRRLKAPVTGVDFGAELISLRENPIW